MKKATSSSEGDSDPTFIAPPTNPINYGKRGGEEVQLTGCKKPKIVDGDMDLALHSDDQHTKVEVSPFINSEETTKDSRNTSESEEKDRADDNFKEEDQRVEIPKKIIEVPPTINSEATTQDSERANIFDEYEEEGIDDGSEEDHQDLKARKKSVKVDVDMLDTSIEKKTPHIPVGSLATGSKTVLMDNLSLSIKEEDVRSFFRNVGEVAEVHFDIKEDHCAGHGHTEFATVEAAKEALKLNNNLLLDHPVRLSLATEMTEHRTKTSHTEGSKTLRLSNLSYAIEEDDVKDLFKDVGEIAEIRFAIRDDRFLGYGHVQFITAEAAQEALKLNNEVILDRRVKLEFARPRGAYPRGNSIENSYTNQRGGKTVYVRGFDCSDGFDKIRSALEKHFGKCGEISRMSVPKDYQSGAPRGVAFIEFADSNGFSQAMGLHGSVLGGSRLTVEEAKKQRGDCREESGYGGGRGSGNGSNGIWVRENSSSRQSGFGVGRCRESSSGRDLHSESGSGRDWRSESSYGRDWRTENGFGRDWLSESGSSSGWHSESGSSIDWHRERGSSSTYWHRETGYNSISGRETSFGSASGRGSGSNSGRGFNRGSSSSYWHRESGSGRETSFGSSWHKERISGRGGYCPGENVSSGGWGRLRDSGPGWRNGSNGSGFSSDRMSRLSGSRGGRP